MTAREKLENLTMHWILYSIVTTAVSLFLKGGLGFWSVTLSAVGLLISIGLSVVIGRALLNRNGLVRGVVALLAAVGALLGGVAIFKLVLLFFATFTFGLFWPLLAASVMVAMNAHSLRVLFSREVRRYFR